GFEGSLQKAAWFWSVIFHGFRNPEPGSPGPSESLYRGCHPIGRLTVRLRLAHPTSSFLAALAFPFLGIASPTALRKYDADEGQADANGVFHPTGSYATAHPNRHGSVHVQGLATGKGRRPCTE